MRSESLAKLPKKKKLAIIPYDFFGLGVLFDVVEGLGLMVILQRQQ